MSFEALRRDGTQKDVVDTMQTRDDLYDFLGYHAYEQKLDSLFARQEKIDALTSRVSARRYSGVDRNIGD